MKENIDKRFTGMQFYLANASNTVHAIAAVDDVVSQEQFESIVKSVLELAPQLQWEENTASGCYRPVQTLHEVLQDSAVELFSSQHEADVALDQLLKTPLADTGRAAFRARCQHIKTRTGTLRSRLVFHTTHGIMEGGDVANILRGRLSTRVERPFDDARLPMASRVASSVLVPLMWLAHLAMAWTEKRDARDFGYVRLVIHRDELKSACTRFGVNQRALLFAVASEAYRRKQRPRKSLAVLYSTLPAKRSRIIDDEYLNVRTDEVTFRHRPELTDYVRHVHEVIASRGPAPMFSATCQRKLLRIHMAIHAKFPWVYPSAFFGFAPQHLILSMIPPVKAERFSKALNGAVVLAGSNTGTATSCIFVPSKSSVGISFWTDISRDELASEFRQILGDLGIDVAAQVNANGPA